MTAPRILLSMGTRPEIIKMIPVYLELKARGLSPLLLHTGQHNEMAHALYQLFDVKPDFYVEPDRKTDATRKHCDLATLSASLLAKISDVLIDATPDAVLVHGDTSSALMTALAAFYQKRKIGHVEAGLRSFDEHHPFPEEKNRVLIGQMAHWHFAPTARAAANLLREGIAEEAIHTVGNTIVQATRLGAEKLGTLQNPVIETIKAGMPGKRIVLVTVHRRENHDHGIRAIAKAVHQLLQEHEGVLVVWPVHPNPLVVSTVKAELSAISPNLAARLILTEPMDYPVLLWVLKHAWVALTDSGGIQEEAVALSTPVLVLRETTERPEVIEVGAGLLVGAETDKIKNIFNALTNDAARYNAMRGAKNPFGDDTVAKAIVDTLLTPQSLKQTG